MKAYRTSVKIKLGLIVAAVAIAVGSLVYTNELAERIMERERGAIQLWASAIEYQGTIATAQNPYASELRTLAALLRQGSLGELGQAERDSLASAIAWARSQPTSEELNFVFNEVIEPQRFSVPAIITDTAMTVATSANNVRVDSTRGDAAVQEQLLRRAASFDVVHEPILMSLDGDVNLLVHYGESDLVRVLRSFPFVQLVIVGLFILVGYLGFSYVRRNEQSSLWVGMAKEAAHQLGTPLSSMMGWIELVRMHAEEDDLEPDATTLMAADELDKDVERLRRVADRFQKIGSVPEVQPQPVAPVVGNVVAYVRRRVPQQGRSVTVEASVPEDLTANLNPDLFEWVIENLLKNALDAIDGDGAITVEGSRQAESVVLDVRDTGRGMDRATARHVFRPGFSTKKRGWGLGLSLAKRIVEDYHGGTLVLLDTKPGQGTCFRLRLHAVSGHETNPSEGDGIASDVPSRQSPTTLSGASPQAAP